MQTIKSSFFNQDNLTLEVTFDNNKHIIILIEPLENSLNLNMLMQSKFIELLYNDPLSFAELYFSGELAEYLGLFNGSFAELKDSIIRTEGCSECMANQIATELLFDKNQVKS